MTESRKLCPDGCGFEAAHCGCDQPASITRRQLQQRDARYQRLTEAAQALVATLLPFKLKLDTQCGVLLLNLHQVLTDPSAGTQPAREAAPAPPSGWQQIETAPKGKIVLMFAVTDRHEDGRVANWKMATGNFGFGDYSERLTWDGDIIDKPYQHRPTHWFALPAPPATKGDAE